MEGVQFDAGQPEISNDLQGFGQGAVMQDRFVDTELSCQLDQLEHIRGVEHQVLRVQLERDPHVEIGCECVDLLPERDGGSPLVVQDVQRPGVPGVDDPVRPPRPGLPTRAALTW